MTAVFIYKRGDTFAITADVQDDTGAPIALTGATLASQIRDSIGTLIAELVVAVDPVVSNRMLLSYAGDTTAWPVGTLRGDIEITWSDAARNTSETLQIVVVDRVTTG